MEARGKAVRGVVKALALALAFPLTCRSRATSRDMLVTRPGLLEAWLVLTSVKYHGNLYILIPVNQRLALTRLRATGPRVAPAEQTGALATEPLLLRSLGAAAVMTNMWKIHL